MIPIENNSWDYVQRLIEKEINSAFKLRITKEDNDKMKFEKDHPYMKRLDETLKQYSVVKVADSNGAHHGADYEEMKQVILDALFMRYAGETIRK
tara:strand:- start:197 stop:481 length:285 start_codon:yes stop_codon:yes gene_type:complete